MTNQLEINRLKQLLEGRNEEYKIFGVTNEDLQEDSKIINKINKLELE